MKFTLDVEVSPYVFGDHEPTRAEIAQQLQDAVSKVQFPVAAWRFNVETARVWEDDNG